MSKQNTTAEEPLTTTDALTQEERKLIGLFIRDERFRSELMQAGANESRIRQTLEEWNFHGEEIRPAFITSLSGLDHQEVSSALKAVYEEGGPTGC